MEQHRTYHIAPKPWTIVRWLSPTQRTVVCRFRKRNDADGHLVALQRLIPDADLKIVFDPNAQGEHSP